MLRPLRPALRLVHGKPPPSGPRTEQPHDELAAVASAAIAGQESAVRTFVLTVGPHILRVVRKVLGPQHPDIDDVAQECVFEVVDALPKWRGESTVMHYACRVAALSAMKARRRCATSKRYSIRDDALGVDSYPSSGPLPDELLAARISADLMRELLDSLPFEQADVLTMHCVLGLTVQEMADMCHVPAETLRSRMRLAKQALRNRVLGDARMSDLVEESS